MGDGGGGEEGELTVEKSVTWIIIIQLEVPRPGLWVSERNWLSDTP